MKYLHVHYRIDSVQGIPSMGIGLQVNVDNIKNNIYSQLIPKYMILLPTENVYSNKPNILALLQMLLPNALDTHGLILEKGE